MELLGPLLCIGGLVAFIAGLICVDWLVEKKRTKALTAYAQSHGYHFEGERSSLVDELTTFKLFNQGRHGKVKNLMSGAKDVGGLRICDYEYTTGSGRHQQVWNQTICLLQTPGRAAPHFVCRLGGYDINFDDDPTLSKAHVPQTSGDEAQLRHFMSPQLHDALIQLSDKDLVLEVVGDTLLIHQHKRLKPDQIDGLVADAINLLRRMKEQEEQPGKP